MRYFLFLYFLYSSLVLTAQSLTHEDFSGYTDLERYYTGALRIAQAETAPTEYRNLYYEEAIDSLKPILMDSVYVNRYNFTEFYTDEPYISNDTLFQYSYQYARKMYNDINIQSKSALRETPIEDNPTKPKCRVMNFTLEPQSSITFEDIMSDISIVIAMIEPGNQLLFSVKSNSGKSIPTQTYEDGLVGFCKWISPLEENMCYIIENPTNKVVSFILMSN